MKKAFAAAVLVVLAGAATAQAGVDFNVSIGIPVPVAPAPVVASVPYPSYAQQVAVVEAPQFIYSPALGFHVSVGVPYDMVYLNNSYYQYRGGYWYGSPTYRGPWSYVSYRWLPSGLHRHHYDRIRYYRDREYRSYLQDRDHYRGNWHRPVAVIDRRYDRRDEPRYDRRDYRNERKEYKEYKDRNRDGRWDHRDGRGPRDGR